MVIRRHQHQAQSLQKPEFERSEMKLISVPDHPIPDDPVVGMLKISDKVSLRYAQWAPLSSPRGTVCIFQGRAEFIEKYFEVISELRGRGYTVATFDWRGQGLSGRLCADPRKGYIDKFSEYDADLQEFIERLILDQQTRPLIALAHSMGAAIVIRALHKGIACFDKVVLTAPMIRLQGLRSSAVVRQTIKILHALGMGALYFPGGKATSMGLRPFSGNIFTSDKRRYARTAAILSTEPALGVGSPTIAWLNAAFDAMQDFKSPSYASSIKVPTLIITAGADQLICTSAIERFSEQIGHAQYCVIGGAKHEVLIDQSNYRAQFWQAFDAFNDTKRLM
jgi:lysophospholipase